MALSSIVEVGFRATGNYSAIGGSSGQESEGCRVRRTERLRSILTVDLEDWYTSSLALFNASLAEYGRRPNESVVGNTRKMLEIFEEFSCRATFFVLGVVAEYYPGLVKEIHRRGHEIATHGYAHRLV